MLLLNRLLDELFARGHKVLLFRCVERLTDRLRSLSPALAVLPCECRRSADPASQFTSQLDIIQDWATEHKVRDERYDCSLTWQGWAVCRIDGTTKQDDRRQQIKAFNTETGPEAPNMFLLSTRSGGVGISLTAADTVIFMDSDWSASAPTPY